MKKQTLAELLRAPLSCAALWFSFAGSQAAAQTTSPGTAGPESTAPAATPEPTGEVDEEIITLSPFVVEASEDADSYTAKSTLAGTRVRTDLRDVASAISVVTSQFMQDTGAVDNTTLLQYTTNTEVGGLLGNFSGTGGGFQYNEDANLLRPANNTRVRGLDSADNTRDYFLSDVPWDAYIVDRVDLQRGPNSILFGVGSPAGIINTSVNTAMLGKNAAQIENRFDNYGSLRWSIDGNLVLIKDTLAVRVAALSSDQKFRQDPAYQDDNRAFVAVRFQPKLFGEDNKTDIRVNYETGSVKANRPRQLPPVDAISPWFYTGGTETNPGLNKAYYNLATQNKNNAPYTIPWHSNAAVGRQFWNDITAYYGDNNSSAPTIMRQTGPFGGNGIGTNGARDQSIGGLPTGFGFAVASYSSYAQNQNSGIAGGSNYSDKSLSDPSIFNFYNLLIDGDNKHEWQDWGTGNIAFSQTLFDDRVGAEIVYNRQRYNDGQRVFIGNSDTNKIGVELNSVFHDGTFNGGDLINNATGAAGPDGIGDNVGRAYIANSDEQANSWNEIDRDSIRFTMTGELRAKDLFGEGTLSNILGKHVFTGLVSQDGKDSQVRNWATSAATTEFPAYLGMNTGLTAHFRSYNYVTYLSPSLMGQTSAAGSKLDRVRTKIKAPSEAGVRIFDNHWNRPTVPGSPGYVDPAAVYTYQPQNGAAMVTSTQSENPANYVGWVTAPVHFLNADEGDKDALTYNAGKTSNTIDSQAITWQGYFMDGMVVPVYGWRKDKVVNDSGSGVPDPYTGIVPLDFGYRPEAHQTTEGESTSYGVVVHMPKSWADKMPGRTSVSVFYNKSENFKADAPRGDFFGNPIGNPEGKTEEYGFTVSTLDDKVTMRANWYETEVTNATLTGGGLGQNGYYLWAVPAWGTAFVANAAMGVQGMNDNNAWAWNYAATDDTAAPAFKNPDGTMNQAWLNHPSTVALRAAIDDWRNIPLDQTFFNAYGNEVALINVEGIRAGDWARADPIWATKFDNQPISGGLLAGFGSAPVMTVTTVSKGVEFELGAQPIKNWNVSLNVSKTFATRQNLAPEIASYITAMDDFLQGPAGDIRLWGGGTGNAMRTQWRNNIMAPYNTLLAQQGSNAPEVAPYRFNIVSTYNFESDMLKGVWIGGGYRWEDKRVLGYEYDTTLGAIDVNRPLKGDSDAHFDMWVGRSQKLSDKINWRIQLNIRNLGESTGLEPVTINPDGAVGYSRIVEGMVWQLTNTFEF